MKLKKFISFVVLSLISMPVLACTSMLISARASGTGRPMMWKHRDTDASDNFIERVEAQPDKGRIGYIALFNGGDSLLSEAWMGVNDSGFAIMNTASYNLVPDTAKYKDREGELMSRALATCATIADFEQLLSNYTKPMGVQANFGVMDAHGGLSYFETNDYDYVRFDVNDSPDGFIIRTNHSLSGDASNGYGYIRYDNVLDILSDEIKERKFYPYSFTEKASRSFWHSLLKQDFANCGNQWVIDQDFIPRYISTASIVIEGIKPDQNPKDIVMWSALGYPPCAVVHKATLYNIPDDLRPILAGYKSPACMQAQELKSKVFPITRGSGKHYIDMDILLPIMQEKTDASMKTYNSQSN